MTTAVGAVPLSCLRRARSPRTPGSPTADWLWNTADAASTTTAGTIYLRKTFTVTDPSTISSAVLRVNGDDGEVAFVNGTQVTSSPGNVDNSWQTSQVADIKSLLVAGTNVIALEGLDTEANASGIIAAAQLDTTRIVTDGTWKALPGTPATPPGGWNTASFDDSAWPAATVLGGYGISPWGTGIQNPAGPSKVYDSGSPPPGGRGSRCRERVGTEVRLSTPSSSTPTERCRARAAAAPARRTPTSSRAAVPRRTSRSMAGRVTGYVEVTTKLGHRRRHAAAVATHPVGHRRGWCIRRWPRPVSFTSSGSLLNEMHRTGEHHPQQPVLYGSDTVYEKGGWTNDNGDYADSEMDSFDAESYYARMMQRLHDDAQDPAGSIGSRPHSARRRQRRSAVGRSSFLLINTACTGTTTTSR
jgi:hypothetical protein